MVALRVVPLWVWAVLIGGGFLFATVAQARRAAYWSGIADNSAQLALGLLFQVDTARAEAEAAEAEAAQAREEAAELRAQDAERITNLEAARTRDAAEADSIHAELSAQIEPSLLPRLQQMVRSYESAAAKADSVIGAERTGRVAERLRADAADFAILALKEVITQHEARDLFQVAEIEALHNAMSPGLALRLKADWWLAAGGLVAGFILGGR